MSDKEKSVFIKMIRQELGIEDDVLLEPDLQVCVWWCGGWWVVGCEVFVERFRRS